MSKENKKASISKLIDSIRSGKELDARLSKSELIHKIELKLENLWSERRSEENYRGILLTYRDIRKAGVRVFDKLIEYNTSHNTDSHRKILPIKLWEFSLFELEDIVQSYKREKPLTIVDKIKNWIKKIFS